MPPKEVEDRERLAELGLLQVTRQTAETAAVPVEDDDAEEGEEEEYEVGRAREG